ncbi:hypothetical protein [Rhodospirillaceae bacterium SYSU D60014]|uniref:hypothetical protein n=1 Tax=Virgifigura deserti TaxID=2268457 RepID=UPI0013C53329
MLGSLGWAVWEVGLDWWQLAPRGDVIVLIGLYLLMPWITPRPDAANRTPGNPMNGVRKTSRFITISGCEAP